MEYKIKYLVSPGRISSAHDDDVHYITGNQLIKLYKVRWQECIIVNTGDETRGLHGEFISLRPKFHGDYDESKCPLVSYNYGVLV